MSSAILRSAWVENDVTVHAGIWEPLLLFLKGRRFPFSFARNFDLRNFFSQGFQALGSWREPSTIVRMKLGEMIRMKMRMRATRRVVTIVSNSQHALI